MDTNSEQPPNLRRWSDFNNNRNVSFPAKKILQKTSKLFTMGSCFATEIRRAMKRRGFTVYPNYAEVTYDKESAIFNAIPERTDTLPHYDTFSMLQEFEAAFGLWPDRSAGFWPVESAAVNDKLGAREVFQDPYRKLVYARTRRDLESLSERVNASITEGIHGADVIVLTLGLTEVWRHCETGRHLCIPPGRGLGGGIGKAEFRHSTFAENYSNVRQLLDLLFSRYPTKEVVLSVSPVPLGETFSIFDIGTANSESKSILRAVAAQICREYDNVTYFPAYEMATVCTKHAFIEDGRHVRREFADLVIATFVSAFSAE